MHGLIDPLKIGDIVGQHHLNLIDEKARRCRILAVTSISRDLQSLEAERSLETT
jgi:hypothetical protein